MDIKVISFNILCGGPEGKYWTDRKDMVTSFLGSEHPDSFGVQEAHINWMNTLRAALPEYAFVGVGRDDGKEDGEFSPVFYLKDKYEVVDSGTFWLSETPDTPSYGWDAACRRVCSYAKLREKSTGCIYVHMNTHLDHRGQAARVNGLQLVLDKAAEFAEPVVCTGDFNFEEGCDLYKQMTSGKLQDSKFAADETMNSFTFNAFLPDIKKDDPPAIIDYINISRDIKAKKYSVCTDKPGGKFPSDHFPVIAELTIRLLKQAERRYLNVFFAQIPPFS